MTGRRLLEKIRSFGYKNSEIAGLLEISEQALNSKLKTKDVKLSFIEELSLATNKSVYEWLDDPISPSSSPGKAEDWEKKYYELLEENKQLLLKLTKCLEDKESLREDFRSKSPDTINPYKQP